MVAALLLAVAALLCGSTQSEHTHASAASAAAQPRPKGSAQIGKADVNANSPQVYMKVAPKFSRRAPNHPQRRDN